MSDEVNLENLDQLPDAADDQSQVDVQAMTFSAQEPADAALADAQGEIDAVAAASPSEDIAEGMAYDSVEAADSTSADDAREAAQDSLQDSIDDSPEGDQAAKSEGTVDADANNDGPAAQADEAGEEAADAGALAVKEFSKSLRTLEGKWYVLHTYSGYEKRVKSNIESRVRACAGLCADSHVAGRGRAPHCARDRGRDRLRRPDPRACAADPQRGRGDDGPDDRVRSAQEGG